VGARQLEAANGQPPIDAPRANDDLFGLKPQTALGFDSVRVDETGRPGVLVNRHPEGMSRVHHVQTGAHSLARARRGLNFGYCLISDQSYFSLLIIGDFANFACHRWDTRLLSTDNFENP
jgi:hypothetical protein